MQFSCMKTFCSEKFTVFHMSKEFRYKEVCHVDVYRVLPVLHYSSLLICTVVDKNTECVFTRMQIGWRGKHPSSQLEAFVHIVLLQWPLLLSCHFYLPV